jgi:hypothetical protein
MPQARRRFVHLGAAGFAALSSGVLAPAAQAQQPAQPPQQPASPGQAPPPPASLPPRPPAIAGDLVKGGEHAAEVAKFLESLSKS